MNWPQLILDGLAALVVLAALVWFVMIVHLLLSKQRQVPPEPQWTDPLDPHGDGTLRPGDPVYDATMRGHAVMGNFGPEGWKFEEFGDEDENSS